MPSLRARCHEDAALFTNKTTLSWFEGSYSVKFSSALKSVLMFPSPGLHVPPTMNESPPSPTHQGTVDNFCPTVSGPRERGMALHT